MADKFVVGLDFGTLSGRAVIVRVSDGTEMGTAVHEYPHGVMDRVLSAADRNCRLILRSRTLLTTWRHLRS